MPPRPLTILHADERLLFVAKPPGMLTVPPPGRKSEPCLVKRLADEGHRVFAVHRLDRETSGVILLARDRDARDALMAEFKARRVEKTYIAVVQGVPEPDEGCFRFPIKDLGATAVIAPAGAPAETRYRVLERLGPCSLVEAVPRTGRHNQIRLHFAHVGLPLVGERKFARGRDARVRHKRAALHAQRLALTVPWTGQALAVEAPLARDLENLLAKLRSDTL